MNVQVLVRGAAETQALQDEEKVFLKAADSGMEEEPAVGGDVPDLKSHVEHEGDSGSLEELLSRLKKRMRSTEVELQLNTDIRRFLLLTL